MQRYEVLTLVKPGIWQLHSRWFSVIAAADMLATLESIGHTVRVVTRW